jgi:hypothetical protein
MLFRRKRRRVDEDEEVRDFHLSIKDRLIFSWIDLKYWVKSSRICKIFSREREE